MFLEFRSSIPSVSLRDALLAVVGAALVAHLIFKRYEPTSITAHTFLLLLPSSVISLFFPNDFSAGAALVVSLVVYLSSLVLSIVFYRLSPFHPLAKYPGPFVHKISMLRLVLLSKSGKRHIHIKDLHECYGDIVRVGPNEVSIRHVSAILPLMGTTGLPKGPHWIGRSGSPGVKSLIALDDAQEHARRRKFWNRAFNTVSLKGYEEIIVKRAEQLVDSLGRQAIETDVAKWFSWFTYDFMSDMAFGGGSEMLRDGDKGSLWHLIDDGLAISDMLGQIPWSAPYTYRIPGIAKGMKEMRSYCTSRASDRIKAGSQRKDLFYYLNNEDGSDVAPSPSQVTSDGTLAIVAGSDTTSTVLTNIIYFLLTHPESYGRLRAEVDSYFPPGENALNTRYHAEMPYLNAVINETLRLLPAVLSGSQRVAKKGTGGKLVGPFFLPEGTSAFVHFYSVHRDPRYFSPLPESFWPERWIIAANQDASKSQDQKVVHNTAAFTPFSFGPANCVGKNLALQEMRMVICLVMQKLEFRFPEGYNPRDYEDGLQDLLATKKPKLPVLVKRREEAKV